MMDISRWHERETAWFHALEKSQDQHKIVVQVCGSFWLLMTEWHCKRWKQERLIGKVESACWVNKIKLGWKMLKKTCLRWEQAKQLRAELWMHSYKFHTYSFTCQPAAYFVGHAGGFCCSLLPWTSCSGIQIAAAAAGCTSVSMVPRGSPCNALLKWCEGNT